MTGGLRGAGVLAIWNGIADGFDREFLRWHVSEHIPERISVPGFLRARRYVALQGHPAYFNFYEVTAPEVLSSEAYLARLNAPSAWTRAVVPYFTDTARTLCRVVESRGRGAAGTVATLRIDAPAEDMRPLADRLAAATDVSAVHLLARHETAAGASAESAMRDRPDETSRTILLVEGAVPKALREVVGEIASDAALAAAGASSPANRGLYQLDYLLDRPIDGMSG